MKFYVLLFVLGGILHFCASESSPINQAINFITSGFPQQKPKKTLTDHIVKFIGIFIPPVKNYSKFRRALVEF